MKRKQILAKAITLGLLLAMPCSAWAENVSEYKFSDSKTLTENMTYTGGLLVEKGVSIIGNNKSLDIQGFFYCKGLNNFSDTLSGSTIDRTYWDDIDQYYPYLNNEVGLANLGSITEVNVLKFSPEYGRLVNQGIIKATTLDLTDLYSNGVHNDTDGEMTVDNIEGNISIDDASGTKFYWTTLSNDGHLIVNNSIKTDVTNNTSGVITYNGTDAISGNLQNAGTVIVTSGNLKITDGRLTVQGNSSQFLGENGSNLQSLEIVNDGIDIGSSWQYGSLIVDGTIKTDFINNYGNLQANTLDINGVEIEGYGYLAGTNYAGATISISNSINISNNASFENKSKIFFSESEAVIAGNGIINNSCADSIIAKKVDEDGTIYKITNLTIEGTLNNEGIIAVKTLDVANGMDAANSKGFYVDNLNILASADEKNTNAFALNKDSYTFISVGVSKNAALTVAGSLTVNDTMALQDGASVKTLGEEENNFISAGSLSVGESGSITTGAITVSQNKLEDGTITTGSVTTGTGSTITADTLSAVGNVSIDGSADISEKIQADSLTVSQTGTIETQTVDITGIMTVDGIANISTSIDAGSLRVGNGGSIRANIDTDSNVTAVPTIDVQNDITLGENADVTAGTITSTNGSLEIGNGSSVTVDTLNLSEGKGTITLGNAVTDADSNKKAAVLDVTNGITANALTSGAGSVITVGADKDIEIAGTLELGGTAAANKITAATLATGADSTLTANTLGVTNAVIGGEATVTKMIAEENVDVNASGSLNAGSMDVTGALTLIKADDKESGAYVKVTNGLTAGAVGIGDYGILEAGSVIADNNMSLGSGASAAIEGDVVAKTLVAADESHIKADNVIASNGVSLGTGVTANVKDIMVSDGALVVEESSVLTAGAVTASKGVGLGAGVTANVNDITVSDGTLIVEDGSELTAGILDVSDSVIFGDKVNAEVTSLTADAFGVGNNSILTAASVTVDGVMSVGEGADVMAGTITSKNGSVTTGTGSTITADTLNAAGNVSVNGTADVSESITTSSLMVGNGGSVITATLNLSGDADEGKGTIILGGVAEDADGNKKAAALNVTNGITANALTSGAGSVITVGADKDIEIAGTLDLGGSAAANKITAATLTTRADSELTANTLGVTNAVIGGEATVTKMIAEENVDVNASGSLNAGNMDVTGALTLIKADDKESGAYVKVTNGLTAGAVGIGDYGILEAGSVIADNNMSLGSGASAAIEGDVVTKALVAADESHIKADNVIASNGVSLGAGVTANVKDITVSDGALVVKEGSTLTASAVDVSDSVIFGDKVNATVTSVTADAFGVGDNSILNAASVNVDGAMNVGEGASATVTKSVETGTLGVASGGSLFADVVMVDGAMSVGQKANVTVTNDVMAKVLTALDGSSIKAQDIIASEGIGLGAGVTANVNDITVSNGALIIEKGSTLTASAVDVSNSVIFGDAVNIKAADVTANELAVGGSSSFTAQNLNIDTEIALGASVNANVNDITAGLLYVQNGSVITANDMNVQSLGFANNVTANVNNAIAKDLLAGQNSVISIQDVSAANISLGAQTNMSANNVKDAKSVALDEKAVLTVDNALAAQSIALEKNASLNTTDIQNAQSIVVKDDAVVNADTMSMGKEASINANGGKVKVADAIAADYLTINASADTEEQVVAKKLDGDKLTVNVNGLTENQVVIGDYTGERVYVIGGSDVTDSFGNGDLTSIEAGMQELANTLNINSINSDGLAKELLAAEGSILGEITGMVAADGSLTVTGEKVNSFNQGISEMASIALMTWRQENNDMNKRLGELRDSSGEHGVWVRMTRGESKYGAQNIKNQYNAYQLGYDEKLSVDKRWTVGAALTYTDANSSFSGGKGENKHKGLAVYGSRLNDDGSFIDLIARYARLEHDFDVRGGAGKGDFDTNGYSLSAEYGKRFTQKSGLWIEPQVELTYGRVGSADYITNKGVRVRQESMDSLVGRLGFALGQNLAKGKGNVYLRASYLYDFDGETDVRFANSTQNRSFKQDLGGGWWEVGVGTNVNLSEAMHLYFDVEKTYGGNVATPWQWNAGLRWSF